MNFTQFVTEKDVEDLTETLTTHLGEDAKVQEKIGKDFSKKVDDLMEMFHTGDQDKDHTTERIGKYFLERKLTVESDLECSFLMKGLGKYGVNPDLLSNLFKIVNTEVGKDFPENSGDYLDQLVEEIPKLMGLWKPILYIGAVSKYILKTLRDSSEDHANPDDQKIEAPFFLINEIGGIDGGEAIANLLSNAVLSPDEKEPSDDEKESSDDEKV